MQTICHDFKSPRSDGVRRLPSIFMLVPIMFYVVLLGGGYLSVTSYMKFRDSTAQRDQSREEQAEYDAKKADFETQKTEIDKEVWKAVRLAQWVEGTRTLQPVGVAILRAVPAEISLGELSLERSLDLPQQLNLNVRINNGTLEDVNRIQNALSTLSYRAYNSQQEKAGDGGGLNYRAMLVWQAH